MAHCLSGVGRVYLLAFTEVDLGSDERFRHLKTEKVDSTVCLRFVNHLDLGVQLRERQRQGWSGCLEI